jgi:hypothetical protein
MKPKDKPEKSVKKPLTLIPGTERLSASFDEDSDLPGLHEATMLGELGEIVMTVCKDNEVHPVFVLAGLLSYLGTYISVPFFMLGGVKYHCNINFVTVGNSSKAWASTSSDIVSRIFDGMLGKPQYLEGHLLNGESLIAAVRGDIPPDDKNIRKEAALSADISDKRLLFHEKEFRFAIANAKRPGNSLSEIVNALFMNGPAELLVKSGKISATGAHVSILAYTSCTDFSALKSDVKQSGEFASHFLWLLLDRLKPVPNPKAMSDKKVQYFQHKIEKIIQAANRLERVKMSKPARELWNNIYPGLTKAESGVAGSVVSRSEIHTIKLALLYALVAGHTLITAKDLCSAHALVLYAWESASIIFKGNLGHNDEEKILCALHTAHNHEMSLSEIIKYVFKNKKGKCVRLLLSELEKKNQVQLKKVPTAGATKIIAKLVSAK